MQLEGHKQWKVYEPLQKNEVLPRTSSRDYTEDDLKDVEPVLDVTLGPGDLLYLPRGWIHQAHTLPTTKEHSLHLTVSAMQQWAWADFLELLLPEALQAASGSKTSTSLREGMPRRFLDYMGAAHDQPEDPDEMKVATQTKTKRLGMNENGDGDKQADGNKGTTHSDQRPSAASKESTSDNDDDTNDNNNNNNSEPEDPVTAARKKLREVFMEEAKKRVMRVTKEAATLIDAACDQMGKRFLSDRLPPAFTAMESNYTSEGPRHSQEEGAGKVWPNTMCRLARPGVARLVLEDDKAILYHCVDNSRVYHGNPLSPMEFEMDDAPALEMLLATEEPRWIMVQDLIHDDIEDKMAIAQALYDEGVLAIMQTEKPDRSVR